MKNAKIGIDVSEWQGEIDFQKAVTAGVTFAMIRSSYGWKKDTQKDKFLDSNLNGFKKLGIPYGIYHYSYAQSVNEAVLEAKFCLKCIGNSKPLFPIFYDMEEDAQAKLGKGLCTDIAVAFCSEIEKAGHKAGIYANAYWFENHLDYDKLSKSYAIWLAHWADKPQYDTDIWQYTSKGKIDGISGNVDMNYMDGVFFNTHTKELDDSKKDGVSTNENVQNSNTSRISLNKAELYVSSNADSPSGEVSGIYWLWDNKVINGRRRITNSKSNIGKDGQVTGWINASEIGSTPYTSYTVKKGDTLWGIAEKLLGSGTEYTKIKSLNNLSSDVIYEGQSLKIPK